MVELRDELRYAIAFQTLGLHPDIDHGLATKPYSIFDLADHLLNAGVDCPVLIELALDKPSHSTVSTDTLRRVVRELDLQPPTILHTQGAIQLVCAKNLPSLANAPSARAARSIVGGLLYKFFTDFGAERIELINNQKLGWLWQVDDEFDRCHWPDENSSGLGFLDRSADEIATEARSLAIESLNAMPANVTGPA